MNIRLLNEKVTFQKNTVTVDSTGNHRNEWTDFFSCASTISDSLGKSNTEDNVAGITADTADISFTVRYCQKSASVTSTEYRILWRKEIYNIQKVDHLNMKKQALKFRCVKARR